MHGSGPGEPRTSQGLTPAPMYSADILRHSYAKLTKGVFMPGLGALQPMHLHLILGLGLCTPVLVTAGLITFLVSRNRNTRP